MIYMKESTVKKNGNAKFVMKNVGCEMRKKKKRGSDTGSRTRGSAVKGLNVTATPYRITLSKRPINDYITHKVFTKYPPCSVFVTLLFIYNKKCLL